MYCRAKVLSWGERLEIVALCGAQYMKGMCCVQETAMHTSLVELQYTAAKLSRDANIILGGNDRGGTKYVLHINR